MKKLLVFLSAFVCLSLLIACSQEPSNQGYSQYESSAVSSQQSDPTSSQDENSVDPISNSSENPSNSVSSKEPTESGFGYVKQGETVSSSYFDDAVFIGDSVSLKLSYYCASTGSLGNAKFLTSGSLGSVNSLWDISDESVHPTFQGSKSRIEDSVAAIGANKVYIMLGMNDIGLYGIDDSINSFEELALLILEKSPSAQIYIQSVTPMASTSNIMGSGLNNEKIGIYNEKLLNLCEANSWYFIDVASVMFNSEGYLNKDYCSDPETMGIHFTESGCERWIEYLYTHTVR